MTSARSLLPRNFGPFPGSVELSWDASRRLWLVLVMCDSGYGSGVAECDRLSVAFELAFLAAQPVDFVLP